MSTPIPLGEMPADLVVWIQRCHKATDGEAAHGLRVTTRRLDAWLRLGGWRVLREDLRWLRTAAAPARDLDVLIEAATDRSVRARLRRQRASVGRELVGLLDSPRATALVQALPHLPAVPVSEARAALARAARRSLSLATGTVEDLHTLRRALRRVRYSLEWLREDAHPLVTVQAVLGEVSDAMISARPDDPATWPDDALLATARTRWSEARGFVARWS